jgi:TRAP-type transport system periplasmic protein
MKSNKLTYVLCFLVATILALFSFTTVGGAQEYTREKPLKMIVAHADTNQDVYLSDNEAMNQVFKYYVEAYSGGRVKIELRGGATLGDTKNLVESLKVGKGLIQAVSADEGGVMGVFPLLEVTQIPYLFADELEAWAFWDGPVGNAIVEELRKQTGLRSIGNGSNGEFRFYTSNKKPIHSPADMKGQKIRTIASPAHMEIARLLGASPTPIPWNETYPALQTGVVDGGDIIMSAYMIAKWWDIQKYLCINNHVYTPQFMLLNDKWFSSLPEEFQTILKKGGQMSVWAGRVINNIVSAKGPEEILKKKGTEIYYPGAQERAEFKRLTYEPMIKWVEQRKGKEWVTRVVKGAEEARKTVNNSLIP